jgi:hypothetical protein
MECLPTVRPAAKTPSSEEGEREKREKDRRRRMKRSLFNGLFSKTAKHS